MTPEEIQRAGNSLLSETLVPAGFSLSEESSSKGSGGHFAVCVWRRRAQFIELHTRYALGIINYGWGDEVFGHDHVVGALKATASYPGFSEDPVDSFRHLLDDLVGPLSRILDPGSEDLLPLLRAWQPPRRRLP